MLAALVADGSLQAMREQVEGDPPRGVDVDAAFSRLAGISKQLQDPTVTAVLTQ